ncbi:MAG: choice-of-anchor D domain-containing protein [bacterium]
MNRRLNPLALLGLLLVVAGCDDGDLTRKRSNDIALNPTTINFARIVPPQTAAEVVTIRHAGETELRVDKVYLEDYPECDRGKLGFSEADRLPDDIKAMCPLIIDAIGTADGQLPARLISGQFFDVNLRFQPVEATVPLPTRLVVESNALNKAKQYVDIGFDQPIPQIQAEPVVAFPGGVPGTEFLLVRNIGSGPLQVEQYTLTLVSEPAIDPQTQEPIPEFIISQDQPLPWTIPENQAVTVQIEYDPADGNRDTAELVFQSNDPDQPRFTVTLTSAPVFGVLSVQPNPAIFGEPRAGDSVEQVISFTNSGVRFVDVQSVTLNQPGEDYSIDSNQQTSFRLAGGQARELRVVYQPATAEGSDAELVVQYDDGDDRTPGTLNIPLVRRGDGLPAILEVAPAAVDMSDVGLGEARTEDIVLTNNGGQALNISRIALSADGEGGGIPASDPEFEIVSGGGATMVAPGASHTVQVKLTRGADDRIVHIAALVVESNAASSPDVVFFTSNPPRE